MPRFAANLSMMYSEVPFLDRFAAAAKDGFKAVEFLFPYDHPAETVAAKLKAAGLENALFNLPPGDWDKGERGIAALPGREAEFAASIDKALGYAKALGCKKLHAMAGLVPHAVDRHPWRSTYIANLKVAAAKLAAQGITLVIEPINTRDIPGYFLNRQDDAHAIITEVGASNLKVQFDIYHVQIVEGDVATKLKRAIGEIGHVQIAGVPERHEPSLGEVNYPYLFTLLDQLGYDGWVGCEYRPQAGTTAGLGWLRDWR